MKILKKITPLSCLEPNKLTTPGNFPSLETTKYLNTMKTTRKHLPFYLFLLVLVWKSSLVQAQSQSDTTYTGNITVGTQAQVNALNTTLAGKTIIDGNVTIGGSDITDLTPLGSIVRITGNFEVSSNDSLTDVGDFPALQTIGGDFWVLNNNTLTDLGSFPVLRSIGGYFRVGLNRELTDVGDFPALQTIGEYFSVGAYSLTDLGDFPVLQTIGGYFSVSSYSLTDLGDFPVLQTIGGGFVVNNNRKLTDVGDFPNLTSIGVATLYVFSEGWTIDSVSVVVENNPGLSDCSVLTDFLPDGMHAVSGKIFINNNAVGCNNGDEIMAPAPADTMNLPPADTIISSLVQTQSGATYTGTIYVRTQAQVNALNTTLAGKTIIDGDVIIGGSDIIDLTPLDSIVLITGAFEVRSNSKLTDIGEFPVLQFIGGSFWVHNNDSLTDLGNFPALQSIGYYFYVWNNNKLTDLGNFPALQAIGDYFYVIGNDILTDLGDFPALLTIEGYFNVWNNSILTDLGNFPKLQTIGGNFGVSENNELTDLGDFPVLQSIGEYFEVYENSKLTDLGDFPVLQSIGGDFWVSSNSKLTDLGDFPNLTSIGTDNEVPVLSLDEEIDFVSIVVENNPSLVLCSWLEDFLPGGMHAVSGKIFINNNAVGCNSGGEIMASTHTKEPFFTLYPNPTKGKLTVEGVTGYLQIFIHDLVGIEVMTYSLTPSKKAIDVSDLPSGMYVLTLQGEEKTWTEVLIIVN